MTNHNSTQIVNQNVLLYASYINQRHTKHIHEAAQKDIHLLKFF
jgi:hypothetical protein